ncbi:MAG: TraR/DksA C4-type zinc finger protein [Burkholderiales bacterium]|nr:TraR/DksA C4-type zinc finger protein [Burkholderiales bacterium]
MLTEPQKAGLARALENRRTQLAREIDEKMADSRARGGSANIDQIIEGGDAALADALAGLDLAEVQRDLAELRDIEAARARLADGSYGTCTDCGEPIALARLEAYPTAKRCTDCQTAYERQRASARPRL